MIGTGLAQVLPFLVTPILTRLYTQDDFARFTTFFAIASILSVAAGGRYFLALVLPKERQEAHVLFGLSIYLTLIYVLLLACVLQVIYWSGYNQTIELIYFVPLYVLFYGIWISAINLSIREKRFLANAYSKVYQAGGYVLSAILFGLGGFTSIGLVLAKTLGAMGSAIYLMRMVLVRNIFNADWEKYRQVAIKYIDYPKYSLVPAVLNTLSAQALILFLAKFYSSQDLGHFGLTFMVLSAPLGLIGISYRDVFYQRIAELVQNGRMPESFYFFKRSARFLFTLGAIIAGILLFLGPFLFGLIFGDEWTRSGEFASILALSLLVKLVASPLSAVFNAANKIRIASYWQTAYFLTTFVTLGIGAWVLKLEIFDLLYLYLVHEVLLYSIYFILEFRIVQGLQVAR